MVRFHLRAHISVPAQALPKLQEPLAMLELCQLLAKILIALYYLLKQCE